MKTELHILYKSYKITTITPTLINQLLTKVNLNKKYT